MSQYSSSHRRSVIDSPIPPVGAPGWVANRRRAGRMATQAIDADRLRPMIESEIRAIHTVINAPGPGLLAGGGRRSTGSDSAAENETTRSRGAGAPRGRVGWSPTDAKSPIGRPLTVTHTTLGTGAMSAPRCDLPRRRSDWSLRATARWGHGHVAVAGTVGASAGASAICLSGRRSGQITPITVNVSPRGGRWVVGPAVSHPRRDSRLTPRRSAEPCWARRFTPEHWPPATISWTLGGGTGGAGNGSR